MIPLAFILSTIGILLAPPKDTRAMVAMTFQAAGFILLACVIGSK